MILDKSHGSKQKENKLSNLTAFIGTKIMNTYNNFKKASELYAKKTIKGLVSWYDAIRDASIRVREIAMEDKRIEQAVLSGLVKFFKADKEGNVIEETERRVAPLENYTRTTDRKSTETHKMIDLAKLEKFLKDGIEEKKAELMSIISFNRWQFIYEF